ncbi:hypothetical protein SAMN05421665_3072 [Yoonia rosea]|uniref:Orotidine 5'-phosphate decarboxylase n=1 Tax=Yoonia rosea TaxID=287098 RepID=A0A1R3XG17_9RHOB|nr:orotidine 5'-phosphate decarboxylase [Yoonia rosea]SIT90342.1 hypothetical protein SAMN05421665_3072 [Yoonia rosea]
MATEIKNIWYNPATSAFEGRIDITRKGKAFRYPCAVEGPIDMSPDEVQARMAAQAKRMSDTDPAIFSHS